MRPLVYVEDLAGEATSDSLGVVSKARQLSDQVAAVLCGHEVASLVREVAAAGARHVYVADDPRLAAPFPQPRVDILAKLIRAEGFDTLILAASSLTTDVASALAGRLDAGLNWDLIDLEVRDGELVGRRLALQDSLLVEVGWRGRPRLALIRPGSFTATTVEPRAETRALPVQVEAWSSRVRLLERGAEEGGDSSIADAEIIVAGGRGLGEAAGFAVLEELATELGGAVAASLPAVEIGWYPRVALVGQSGKSVAPKLYLACGISGAIQHKLGMQNAATIVAINTDRDAPIFGFSDLAVVGDLYEIVPKLTELVRQRRAGALATAKGDSG